MSQVAAPANKTTTANAWSRAASSNIRNAPTAKAPAAPPGLSGNQTQTLEKADATLTALRDRFLHLTLNLIGQTVQVKLTDGSLLEGVLYTSTAPFSETAQHPQCYILKSVRVLHSAGTALAIQQGGVLMLPAHKVAHLLAKSVRMAHQLPAEHNASQAAFRTDTDISTLPSEAAREAQDFVAAGSAWTAPVVAAATATMTMGDLDDPVPAPVDGHQGRKGLFGTALPSYNHNNNNSNLLNKQQMNSRKATETLDGSIGHWDQFTANEKLYGVKATFDENLYTTVLNVESIDKSKRDEAERIAREIESQGTSNIHLAEERGQSVETDFDEEDLYSGVLKTTAVPDRKERTKITLLARTKEPTNQVSSSTTDATTSTITDSNHKTDDNLEESTNNTKPKTSPSETITVKSASSPSLTTMAQPQPPKKTVMNYAAAAAKADAKFKTTLAPNSNTMIVTTATTSSTSGLKKSIPTSAKEPETKPTKSDSLDTPLTDDTLKSHETNSTAATVSTVIDSTDANDSSTKSTTSKLNANAKEFTFNPEAKSFTPSFSTNTITSIPTDPDPQQFIGMGPYNPYMQHPSQGMPGLPMGASMMYPYAAGGMRYQAGPYVMMPSNAYMTLPPTQSMSVPVVISPRTINDSPIVPMEGGKEEHENKVGENDPSSGHEVHEEAGGESVDESENTWDNQQQAQSTGTPPMAGYNVPPNVNASVYYPGGNMTVHASHSYGHMMPPQMSPMVQGPGGYSIVYGVPGPMGYGQMRGQPMAYSSSPYVPYGVQGMVAPGSTEGGAGRGGRGMAGMNNSGGGGRVPRRPSGRNGNNVGGRTGSTQVQGSLRGALGNNTRYYPNEASGGSDTEAGLSTAPSPEPLHMAVEE